MNDHNTRRRRGGISVQGVGSVTIEPDIAVLSIGINWRGPELSATRQTVGVKATAARDHLLASGVDQADLQTSQLSVNTIHHDRGRVGPDGGRSGAIEFQVGTTLRAIFRNGISTSQDAVDGLFDIVGEGLELRGLGFDCSDRSAAEIEARRLAFEDATTKAEQLAELAGTSLERVRDIRELEQGIGPQPRVARRAMLAAEASMPVEGGSLTETVALHVRWSVSEGD
jgi:uncharacterized protein YggE